MTYSMMNKLVEPLFVANKNSLPYQIGLRVCKKVNQLFMPEISHNHSIRVSEIYEKKIERLQQTKSWKRHSAFIVHCIYQGE